MATKYFYPSISLCKADKGAHVLRYVQQKLGGHINSRPARGPKMQTSQVWAVGGKPAIDIVTRLIPYLRLKKQKAEAIAQWKASKGRFAISNNVLGVRVTDLTKRDAARKIGVGNSTVYRYSRSGKTFKGWCVTRESGTGKQICDSLDAIKSLPDKPLSEPLDASWTAGFFDAEGYVAIKKGCCVTVAISQKYPAVTDALKRQHGGGVCAVRSGQWFLWTVYGENAIAFLQTIQRDVLEKAEQVKLCLSASLSNWQEIETQMKALRGKQL